MFRDLNWYFVKIKSFAQKRLHHPVSIQQPPTPLCHFALSFVHSHTNGRFVACDLSHLLCSNNNPLPCCCISCFLRSSFSRLSSHLFAPSFHISLLSPSLYPRISLSLSVFRIKQSVRGQIPASLSKHPSPLVPFRSYFCLMDCSIASVSLLIGLSHQTFAFHSSLFFLLFIGIIFWRFIFHFSILVRIFLRNFWFVIIVNYYYLNWESTFACLAFAGLFAILQFGVSFPSSSSSFHKSNWLSNYSLECICESGISLCFLPNFLMHGFVFIFSWF